MRVGTANEEGEGCVLDLDVVKVAALSGHKANILFAPHRLSDAEFHVLFPVRAEGSFKMGL
jgi:hypothetical protein